MTSTANEVGPGFLVWWPDAGRAESEAIFYHSTIGQILWMPNFQEAAEHYAKHHCDYRNEPFESVEVYVRDTLTRTIRAVTVKVEFRPRYGAAIWREIR